MARTSAAAAPVVAQKKKKVVVAVAVPPTAPLKKKRNVVPRSREFYQTMGSKGGKKTARKHGKKFFKALSLKRKSYKGGRPAKPEIDKGE